MPAPYRQACSRCVQSKRKCDLALPRCQRCKSRSYQCHYESNESKPASGSPVEMTADATSQPWQSDDLLTDTALQTPTALQLDTLDLDFLDPSWLVTVSDPDKSLQTPHIDFFAHQDTRLRILYSVVRLKLCIKHAFEYGRNLFISKDLYHDNCPAVFQDALSACAFYASKTKYNESVVFGTITRKAQKITQRQEPWTSVHEHLASVQALILYQIIRLFDGDIRQRADAEQAEESLNTFTQQLKAHIKPVQSQPSEWTSSDDPSESWRSWALTESIRRTIIMSFTVQGVYGLIKTGQDHVHHEFDSLSYTAQMALWHAPSEYHWRQARAQRDALPICLGTLTADVVAATPSDVEEMTAMMMVLMWGIDKTSHWLGHEHLGRFGLEEQSREQLI